MKINSFCEYIVENLEKFGEVKIKAMFGGYGLYFHEKIFAIIADEELYFKGTEQSEKFFQENKMI